MQHPLITPAEATKILDQHSWRGAQSETIDILNSIGRICAADWYSDRDQPPFDRVMMDGLAIRFSDFESGQRDWRIDGLQAAGDPMRNIDSRAEAYEIMTGAIMVDGLDTVIPYEQLQIEQGRAKWIGAEVRKGQHVHLRASDKNKGDLVLRSGSRIGPTEIGIAASIGLARIAVRTLPRITIISTGNELVEIETQPLQHQIRKSNVYALASACFQLTGILPSIQHANDSEDHLRNVLSDAVINSDMILLSGGVSMGKLDYVPQIVRELGAKIHFHGVAQRPGKPIMFASTADCAIFGLPGNPVSTLVGWSRYVRPWICGSLPFNVDFDTSKHKEFKWSQFIPVQLNGQTIEVLTMNGSGDFMALAGASGFLEIEPDGHHKKMHRYWCI
jgi:molybdopterin molybdotransferase